MSYLIDDVARILATPMPRRRALALAFRALAGGAVLANLGTQPALAACSSSTCVASGGCCNGGVNAGTCKTTPCAAGTCCIGGGCVTCTVCCGTFPTQKCCTGSTPCCCNSGNCAATVQGGGCPSPSSC